MLESVGIIAPTETEGDHEIGAGCFLRLSDAASILGLPASDVALAVRFFAIDNELVMPCAAFLQLVTELARHGMDEVYQWTSAIDQYESEGRDD